MFLFNSLHQGSNASKNPSSRRPVFALAVMFCLSTALLVTGCKMEPESENTGFIPAGEWADSYGSGYKITKSSIEYYTAYYSEEYPGENIKGDIKEAIDFSHNAGVLLVQITASAVPGQEGKFIGVYYKDYTNSHVFLANAIDGSYALIVKDTLAEAKNTFTVDNVGTHVDWSMQSGYRK
jgi:hypothetical protein